MNAGKRRSRQLQPPKGPEAACARLFPLRDALEVFVDMGLPLVKYETLRLWRSRGVSGAVLETQKFGGRYFTSRGAVERFVASCAEGAR